MVHQDISTELGILANISVIWQHREDAVSFFIYLLGLPSSFLYDRGGEWHARDPFSFRYLIEFPRH